MDSTEVMTVAETRDRLSGILRTFRADALSAEPVLLGSHRKPEAVIIPFARFVEGEADVGAAHEPTIEKLHRLRGLIGRLAQVSNIEAVSVFGSVARGEDTADSDIDLLVDPTENASLFDFARFELDMEALLERPVDVISRRALDPLRDAEILSDSIAL